MADNYRFFSLIEISEWQLNNPESKVILPPLQRGFVWKVNQIESLWDSLFRGFPIGSFLFSKNNSDNLDLLDGQQRATTIALGFHDPWHNEANKIGSLKGNPVVWLDLVPNEITETQKFVIRVVTKSHPWGYLRKYNDRSYPLSSADKNRALTIFRNISGQEAGYTQFSLTKVFPFDANLPVPLCFVIRAIKEKNKNWKDELLILCKEKLPANLRTKYFEDEENYFEKLEKADFNSLHLKNIYNSVCQLDEIKIPGIFVPENVLFEEDGETTDPTLFIRFNRGGTRIEGEELIYSIYKAAFPETKELVENIQADYLAPSRIISLVIRLALSEIENSFTYGLNPVQFKKKIKDTEFKTKLREFIGKKGSSPSEIIFNEAIKLLRAENEINLPPVLVKKIVNGNADLFLMLLYWIRLNKKSDKKLSKTILAVITSLSFFGKDNSLFVKEIWNQIKEKNFWEKQKLRRHFANSNDFVMYPLQPSILKEFLVEQVINNKHEWNSLYPIAENNVQNKYRSLLISKTNTPENESNSLYEIWNFMNILRGCNQLVLFAQRKYINETFPDFNQMDSIEDTNTPWDIDHIYPSEWVYNAKKIDQRIRDWNSCIGNLRAISFEQNRSDSNIVSPNKKFMRNEQASTILKENSFVNERDWRYWEQINDRIYYNEKEVNIHSSAVINRMINIYDEWYKTLFVEDVL